MSDDEERVKSSIFVSELEQIFKAIKDKIEDQQENKVFAELTRCIPNHHMSYIFILNMEQMKDVKPLAEEASNKSEIE